MASTTSTVSTVVPKATSLIAVMYYFVCVFSLLCNLWTKFHTKYLDTREIPSTFADVCLVAFSTTSTVCTTAHSANGMSASVRDFNVRVVADACDCTRGLCENCVKSLH